MSDVTQILSRFESGDATAADRLLPLVYDELRKLAAAKLAREKPGQTLQATALVHEAYLKLAGGQANRTFAGRRHFFAAAAQAMRQILIDQARRKLTVKHGGEQQRSSLELALPQVGQDPEETLAINELIDRLGDRHPRSAEVARQRLFLGMTCVEAAEVLGVSADTVETDWAYARAWLKREWQR